MKENQGKCWFCSFCGSLHHWSLSFGRTMNYVLALMVCQKGEDFYGEIVYMQCLSLCSQRLCYFAWKRENKAVPQCVIAAHPFQLLQMCWGIGKGGRDWKKAVPLWGGAWAAFDTGSTSILLLVTVMWQGIEPWLCFWGWFFWLGFGPSSPPPCPKELNIFAIKLNCSCNLWQLWA